MGGEASIRALLAACCEAGAAPAAAGEFTRRAFLNGRISLTQAEAVMEMIEATCADGARAAAAAMEGSSFSEDPCRVRPVDRTCRSYRRLYRLSGRDVEELREDRLRETLTLSRDTLKGMLDSYESGSILRRGVRTAIVAARMSERAPCST